MDKWKLALKEFLKDYEEDDNVIGAVLSGNYANDTYNSFSHIEVILVLKDELNYTEKGINSIQSFMIEYYKLPVKTIKRYFKENYNNRKLTMVNMFAYGKIIYDLECKVKELQDLALDYIDRPFDVISSYELSLNNYLIWNSLNELKSLMDDNNLNFNMVYYNLLWKIYEVYSMYLGIPILSKTKLYRILTDSAYQKKYHVFKLPDEKFIDLYLNCYNELRKEEMYKNISKLVNYYYTKQGGFNIRTFNLKKEL